MTEYIIYLTINLKKVKDVDETQHTIKTRINQCKPDSAYFISEVNGRSNIILENSLVYVVTLNNLNDLIECVKISRTINNIKIDLIFSNSIIYASNKYLKFNFQDEDEYFEKQKTVENNKTNSLYKELFKYLN